jgi:putative peptidoglycan lipid II flippase
LNRAKSSLVMAAGTVLSRVLGFARAVLLAAMIGVTTNAADAFGVANQLPNNVYAIIAGGVLNAVLVPQIVRARNHFDGGKIYIDRLLTLAITVFATVTVVITIAAPVMVRLYTSSWSHEQLALATAFAYWCLPQLFFYGLYSVLGEVLNARSAFGPYMWAPVLNNIVAIAGMVAFIAIFGFDPTGQLPISGWSESRISLLAGTATAGVAAQALILFLSWRRIGLVFKFNFKWRGVGLRPAMKAASWSLGMLLVTQIGGLVQTIVASRAVNERDGSSAVAGIAAASIAWLIFMLPHSVATVSIATAYFTSIAKHAHEGRMQDLKADLASGLRTIALISVLATVALTVLAYSASRVFVGEFPATVALGNVVIASMIGLVPFSFVYMMQRAYYALEDTRTPFFFTLIQIGLHITASITLALTADAQYLVVGLALITSTTVTVQSMLAYRWLTRRIGSLREFAIARSTAVVVTAGLITGGVGWLVLQLLGGVQPGSFVVKSVLSAVTTSAIDGLVMLVVYVVLLKLFRVQEVNLVFARISDLIQRLRGIARR